MTIETNRSQLRRKRKAKRVAKAKREARRAAKREVRIFAAYEQSRAYLSRTVVERAVHTVVEYVHATDDNWEWTRERDDATVFPTVTDAREFCEQFPDIMTFSTRPTFTRLDK